MWILSSLGTDDKVIILPGKEKFSVGRSGTDLVLKDDLSVSRTHAVFHITNGASHKIELEDCGSRYGTFYNDGIKSKQPVAKSMRITLQDGDRILFGAINNIWHLSHFKIRTLASALTRSQFQKLETALLTLGGKVEESWSRHCTHLTMDDVSVTVKLLHALLEQLPVVNNNYWLELIKLANRCHFSGTLPNPKYFSPKNPDEMDIGVRPERKSLFSGKTFVFMNRKHNEMYGPIVKKAGATCKDLNSGVKTAFLTKDNVIVIQFVPSTQSQATETITSISAIVEQKSLRLIPEYEIGLAIVYCSTEKYCNPKYKLIKDILPTGKSSESQLPIGTMFVENTAEENSARAGAKSEVFLPESEEAISKKKKINPNEVIEIFDEGDENDCMPADSKAKKTGIQANQLKRKRQNEQQQEVEDDDDDIRLPKKGRKRNVFASEDEGDEEELPLVQVKKNLQLNVEPILEKSLRRSPRKNVKTPEPDKAASSTKIAKDKATKSITEKIPLPTAKSPKKTLPVEKPKSTTLIGFLEKSQNNNNNKETNKSDQAAANNSRKRQHISVINDSNDDDDDDFFNFGDPKESQKPKKARTSNAAYQDGSDDELFDFDGKSTEPQNNENLDSDDLKETEPFEVAVSNCKGKSFVIPKPKPLPSKVNISDWLSCSIKQEGAKKEEPSNNKNSMLEPEHAKWLDSIKNSIVVGMIDLNIKAVHVQLDQTDSLAGSNATITATKNFKSFRKTCLNKQQPRSIKLVPSTLGMNL